MDKKRKRLIITLIALAILIIPFVGVSLAVKGPAFLKSLSRIAGDGKHFGHLFIFGNLVIIFILISVYYLFNYYKLGNKKTNISFFVSCVLLEITVLTPYIPEENIVISKIHNYCAYVSIVLLVISLFWVIFSIPNISRKVFIYISGGFALIVIVCLTIFLVTGSPSSFFELTLINCSVDLILLLILLLHHNEKNKINGTLDVKYKIVKNKKMKLHVYEAYSDLTEPYPLILHEMNLQWKDLIARSSINPFRKVFVYYDNINKKHNIGLLTKKRNTNKNCITISNDLWAVFYLDNTFYTTKEHAWNFIKDSFLVTEKYIIKNNIYLEKYVVTKNENIRKCQIWVPITKK